MSNGIVLGSLAYWKRDDLFGDEHRLGDACSVEQACESPLVCSDLICTNAPVDCEFQWVGWSPCSATACNSEGIQTRTYKINKDGMYGGIPCEYAHEYTEEKPCSTPTCTQGEACETNLACTPPLECHTTSMTCEPRYFGTGYIPVHSGETPLLEEDFVDHNGNYIM